MITVLEKEQDMDFIFGLDMLKRHQCNIDLKVGRLLLNRT
jgi:DNA damage-inducible protein 1